MTVTQADIDQLVQRLRALVDRLAAARAAAAPLESALAAVQHEFEAAVGALRRRELALCAELRSLAVGPVGPAPSDGDPDTDVDHDPVGPEERGAPGAAADADAIDKDVLLEHVVRVLDTMDDADAQELVVTLQQALDDPTATLGQALEQLPPGPVWERRGAHETLADQRARLLRWEAALEQRIAAVEAKRAGAASDPRFGLWRQHERGADEWRWFLQRAEEHQRARNAELEIELAEARAAQVGTS
jgi:hypothetical protein